MRRLEVKEGQRFGIFIVIKEIDRINKKNRRFLVQCNCGKLSEIDLLNLRYHNYKNCGYCKKRNINIGDVYGRLTVLKDLGSEKIKNRTYRMFELKCECGNIVKLDAGKFFSGNTKSCGCYLKQISVEIGKKNGKKSFTHGHSIDGKSRTYNSWQNMKARCYNPKSINYDTYGGDGITVCDRWRHSFENFLEDMGERPEGMTLDRIDPYGNYEPSNCRWATIEQQANNKKIHKRKKEYMS